MDKVYLVECYIHRDREETTHYVASAHKTREKAVQAAKQILNTYFQERGYDRKPGNNKNLIGWLQNSEENRFYWINEVEITD